MELKELLLKECDIRKQEDMDVLDTILDTQQRLQTTVSISNYTV